MTLQMGMSREDRDPADVLTTWALKEYERLQQEAPPIGGGLLNYLKINFVIQLKLYPILPRINL